MRRLTPDKIRGYRLPAAPRINRGNTSIIYETGDPAQLEVFTIEQIKLDWWQYGLGVIADYAEVASAHYEGYKSGYYTRQYEHLTLPVYRCLVERLDSPAPEQMRRIRQIQRAINKVCVPYHQNHAVYMLNRWDAIRALEIAEIAPALDFIYDYDLENIYPDFGRGDFMIRKGQIVALDPFHRSALHAALMLCD